MCTEAKAPPLPSPSPKPAKYCSLWLAQCGSSAGRKVPDLDWRAAIGLCVRVAINALKVSAAGMNPICICIYHLAHILRYKATDCKGRFLLLRGLASLEAMMAQAIAAHPVVHNKLRDVSLPSQAKISMPVLWQPSNACPLEPDR